ncbi:MAG: SpoIIE family protein phosphatase [Phycisphaerales bacterium]|nr:SpoIIE family protein phosphatase [Phycisphaerales bacterium]
MDLLSGTQSAWLVAMAGPPLEALELVPQAGGLTIGRHEEAEIRLPADAEQVSRQHARLECVDGRWHLTDLKSRWGTFLNGVALEPGRSMPLSDQDMVRITPWTFGFHTSRPAGGVDSVNDLAQMQTIVRSIVNVPDKSAMRQDRLALLLEAASAIHSAADETALAKVVLDEALRGTGLTGAAWLRPVDAGGRVQVIAQRGKGTEPGKAVYSRSLLAAAAAGNVAELSGGSGVATSQSIVQMNISSALCVPLTLGTAIAAYLYLDSRQRGPATLPAGASEFCMALGRIASLALANLKRQEIERRHALIEAELCAGAEAQKWILPPRTGRFGPLSYTGESRPGTYMAGDFFDVIPLEDGRLAVALGDVAGKGAAASVLMTAAQGFLHAALRQHGDPGRAASDLNRFIQPRCPHHKFITLWLGVFDVNRMKLNYVDAGHGWALLCPAGHESEQLNSGGGLPVGVMEDTVYEAQEIPLPAASSALIVSDGMIEQFGPPDADGTRHQFELSGVRQLTQSHLPHEFVDSLFTAIYAHAASTTLSDDATAVVVQW